MGALAGEGVDPHAEAAHELIVVERRRKRQVAQHQLELLPARRPRRRASRCWPARVRSSRAAQRPGDGTKRTALAGHLGGGGIEQAVDVEAGHGDGLLDLARPSCARDRVRLLHDRLLGRLHRGHAALEERDLGIQHVAHRPQRAAIVGDQGHGPLHAARSSGELAVLAGRGREIGGQRGDAPIERPARAGIVGRRHRHAVDLRAQRSHLVSQRRPCSRCAASALSVSCQESA